MSAEIAVVGAGYVGIPLADAFAAAGKAVVLVDIDDGRVAALNRGESYIQDVPSERLAEHVAAGRIAATTDYDVLREASGILIALPTPLSKQREPDLSIVSASVREIARRLRKGHVVVLESTTYPGLTPACTSAATTLYAGTVDRIVEVSSPEAAELTKLLENIFRSVNIALVNELARLCGRMKIDIWEVVDAAATKPFGFMSFRPGPGLGGHCIPIDPFYLTWKAREYDFTTEFIELAGKVNQSMPYYCRSLISQALNHGAGKSLAGSKVLVLGVSYKRDIGDIRESPALKIIELIRGAGADVSYHDPHVPELPHEGLRSVTLEPAAYDCVVIVTDHTHVDYAKLVDEASLVVDFRNATGRNGTGNGKVWKL
jgi:UDP-N-acetyl-D-glucosamine dehydrogenase